MSRSASRQWTLNGYPRGRVSFVALLGAAAILSLPAVASANDLTVLRAALEERLTSIRTLEVRYRAQQERTERSPDTLTDDLSVTWWWTEDGRERYWLNPPAGSSMPQFQWAYDGRRTVAFFYGPGKSDPQNIEIHPGPPRATLSEANYYPALLGQRLWGVEGSVLDGLRSPSVRMDWTTDGAGDRVPAVAFPARNAAGAAVSFRVSFDSTTSGVVQSFELKTRARDGQLHWTTLIIDGVVAVPDPMTGQSAWFPQSARREAGVGEETWARSRIELDEVKLNHAIPDSRFSLDMPFGAEVAEYSTQRGQEPRHYLVGGQPAMDAALRAKQEAVQRELQRLDTEGLQTDARPPQRDRWTRWLVGLGVVCVVSATVVVIRRRRHA